MKDTIFLEDCLDGIKKLDDGTIDCVITSPPYNLNIKYGKYKDDLPRTSYLKWLGDVSLALHRVLKDDGHLFLNVGYSNVDPWVAMDVAQVFRQQWTLQNQFAWVKSIYTNGKTHGHFKPINSRRFVSPTWEYLFHFTKTGAVVVDRLAVGVPYEYYEDNLRNPATKSTKKNLRCKGNSWFIPYETINSKDLKGNHPATFPLKLVEDCIKISGKKEGIVMDPFMGTGTVAIGAKKNGLNYIGYEIDRSYVEFAKNRINESFPSVLLLS